MDLLSVIRRWHFRQGMPIRESERRPTSRATRSGSICAAISWRRFSRRQFGPASLMSLRINWDYQRYALVCLVLFPFPDG